MGSVLLLLLFRVALFTQAFCLENGRTDEDMRFCKHFAGNASFTCANFRGRLAAAAAAALCRLFFADLTSFEGSRPSFQFQKWKKSQKQFLIRRGALLHFISLHLSCTLRQPFAPQSAKPFLSNAKMSCMPCNYFNVRGIKGKFSRIAESGQNLKVSERD